MQHVGSPARDLQHTVPTPPVDQHSQQSDHTSSPSSSHRSTNLHRPSFSNHSEVSMPDSTTPPSSQSQGSMPYQASRHPPDPFVDSTPAKVKRPLTPPSNSDWRDQTVSASSSPVSPDRGSKRTASGHVKTHEEASPATRSRPHGHKRTISQESALSNISQLSEQLKTRLSYAMVKVQNGWETCSIDQVESLASQHGSPMSTTSPFRRGSKPSLTSPRVLMANANRRSRDLSHITSQIYPMSPPEAPRSTTTPRRSLMLPPVMGPLSTSPTRSSPYHPSLAPPFALTSSERLRRLSASNPDPDTRCSPHRRPAYPRPKTPTPQEQDAVDTLLFMSSPAAASTHFPAPRTSASGNASAASRPWVPRTGSGGSSSEESHGTSSGSRGTTTTATDAANYERQAKRRSFGVLRSTRDVEEALDEMGGGASSEEDVVGVVGEAAVGRLDGSTRHGPVDVRG